MPNNSDRVLAYLAAHPEGQNDDQIGEALHIDRIQINAICRRLAEAGALLRGKPASGGKILNRIASQLVNVVLPATNMPVTSAPIEPITVVTSVTWLDDSQAVRLFTYVGNVALSEDQVKVAVKQVLEADGWQTEVHFGHTQGIDIEAIRDNERFVLEAKGEGISDQVRGNYFDGALGELLRRMNAPDARYGLALPAHRRFGSLVGRLPLWVRQRLGLWFFFVRPSEHGLEVGVLPPNDSHRLLSRVASGDANNSE